MGLSSYGTEISRCVLATRHSYYPHRSNSGKEKIESHDRLRRHAAGVGSPLSRRSINFVVHNDQDIAGREGIHGSTATIGLGRNISSDGKNSSPTFSHPTINLLFRLRDIGIHGLENFDLLH